MKVKLLMQVDLSNLQEISLDGAADIRCYDLLKYCIISKLIFFTPILIFLAPAILGNFCLKQWNEEMNWRSFGRVHNYCGPLSK